MSHRYDAIVVGARCAGAATAMLLARAGHDVLLVDRATFPSDIPHGHFLHRGAPARLQSWGLLDDVLATSPAVTTILRDDGDFPLVGRDLEVDGVPAGVGPRRSTFDALLVRAAVKAGAELRERFPVDELLEEDGRVAGVRSRGCEERGRVVVGADGRNSRLARAVGARAYEAVPTMNCWYFSYWSGVPAEGLEIYVRDGRAVLVFPTDDGLTSLVAAWPIDAVPVVRAAPAARMMAAFDAVPGLGERVRAGVREERIYGAAQLPNFLRVPYGPGWALVGDAGCHKDPILALGMGDALRDAELLAAALHEGLSGETPLAVALAGYHRRRDEETLPGYRENLEEAWLRPLTPEAYERRAALLGDPEATRRFFLARQRLAAPLDAPRPLAAIDTSGGD